MYSRTNWRLRLISNIILTLFLQVTYKFWKSIFINMRQKTLSHFIAVKEKGKERIKFWLKSEKTCFWDKLEFMVLDVWWTPYPPFLTSILSFYYPKSFIVAISTHSNLTNSYWQLYSNKFHLYRNFFKLASANLLTLNYKLTKSDFSFFSIEISISNKIKLWCIN